MSIDIMEFYERPSYLTVIVRPNDVEPEVLASKLRKAEHKDVVVNSDGSVSFRPLEWAPLTDEWYSAIRGHFDCTIDSVS